MSVKLRVMNVKLRVIVKELLLSRRVKLECLTPPLPLPFKGAGMAAAAFEHYRIPPCSSYVVYRRMASPPFLGEGQGWGL